MHECDKCGQRPGTLNFMEVSWICMDCFLFIKYMIKLKQCNPHMDLRG